MNQIKKIIVAMLPGMEIPTDPGNAAAVVIDTLRFTTTAVHAIQSGACTIHVAQEMSAARELAGRLGHSAKLCGERHCRPIEGFDLGNSPLEYSAESVLGNALVFSTTNGTRAVEATHEFADCWLAALVNRTAIAQAIEHSAFDSWYIVCAGTDGRVAGEDLLAAGAILQALQEYGQVELVNDAARLAMICWQNVWKGQHEQLVPVLESFSGGNNLIQTGYHADIRFACQVDLLDAIPARDRHGAVFRKLVY